MAATDTLHRRLLRTLLLLNGAMFVVEVVGGLRAGSMGVLADGLDMGADAAVYLLALLAVGASSARKLSAARVAWLGQLTLGVLAVAEVARRLVVGSDPETPAMVVLSLIALAVNVTCLYLLRRQRHGEVHLQAAWIFSATDVQANLGVLLAAALVRWLGSPLPDLAIAVVICGLVLRGAVRIRRRIKAESAVPGASSNPNP